MTSFWKTVPLEEMNEEQWESLCDGCGRCCLVKVENEDNGEIYATHVGCSLFDRHACACSDYANRSDKIPDCVRLTPEKVRTLPWLPVTCGYRLVAQGDDLPWWHPLVSGTPQTVIEAGVSVRGKVPVLENEIHYTDIVDHIVSWPQKWPKAARKPKTK